MYLHVRDRLATDGRDLLAGEGPLLAERQTRMGQKESSRDCQNQSQSQTGDRGGETSSESGGGVQTSGVEQGEERGGPAETDPDRDRTVWQREFSSGLLLCLAIMLVAYSVKM